MLDTRQISKALRLISSDANQYAPRKHLFRLQFLDFQGHCQPLEEYKSLNLCEHCIEPQADFYQREFEAERLVVPSAVGITYREESLTVQERICHCSHCYLIIQTPCDFSKEVVLSWAEGLSDWEFNQALIFSANNYELFQILRNEHAALQHPNELNRLALRIIDGVNPNPLSRFFRGLLAFDFSCIYELGRRKLMESLCIHFSPLFLTFLKKVSKNRNGLNQGQRTNPSAHGRSIASHMSSTSD